MAHENDQVVFPIKCGKCRQGLTAQADGVYAHNNNADCDAGDVVLPAVTPDALAALFKPKKKASPKKTAKK